MPHGNNHTLIKAANLTKSFGDLTAVSDLTLQVRAGEIYGLVGPDGAGKTTLIRMLCGAIRPDSGAIFIGEHDIVANPDQAREDLGYLSQRFSLYQDLTVLENLRFFAEVRGLSPHEWRPRTLEILDFVGLGEYVNRRAGQLSGGMKQKLGLATALVHRPSLLLLDEPTGGVDPVTRQDFWQLLIHLVTEEGVGVLVSTPYMDEVMRCTWVGMMVSGKLILQGTPGSIRSQLKGRVIEVQGAHGKALKDLVSQVEGVEDIQFFGDRLHLRVAEGQSKAVIQHIEDLAHKEKLNLSRITLAEPQLEDVFIAMLEADHD